VDKGGSVSEHGVKETHFTAAGSEGQRPDLGLSTVNWSLLVNLHDVIGVHHIKNP